MPTVARLDCRSVSVILARPTSPIFAVAPPLLSRMLLVLRSLQRCECEQGHATLSLRTGLKTLRDLVFARLPGTDDNAFDGLMT